MRKLYNVLVAILLATNVFAQAPQKMSYQGIIHNANNNLVKNQLVGMKISILSGTTDGTAVYVETQTPTTNDNGLISIEIGGGVVQTGTFAGINWANGTYFIKTETDPAGGTNYSITGTSQLLSVPYALHAKTAESISGYAISQQIPIVETQAAIIDGFSATLNAKINGNGFNTSINFEWGLTADYGNSLTATPSSINGSNDVNVTAKITGLQSNTTYHYRINATNAINTTKSNDLTFKTLIVAPVLTTKAITSIGSIYSTSGGNIISDGGWAITSKGVCWSTHTNPTILDNKTNDGNGIGEFTSSLSGLLPNTTYFVKAYAINDAGIFYSDEVSFKTTLTMAIGDLYLGGKIAYLDASGVHGFVCALTDQSTDIQWSNGSYITTGASNTLLEITGVYGITKSGGRKNTDAIILAQGAGNYAASICAALTTGGASPGDWYLPSLGELKQIYNNYTLLGDFGQKYWSSSEDSNNNFAWRQYFLGGQTYAYKDTSFNVRAIRAF